MVKVEDIQNYGKEHLESVAASASNLQSGVQAIASAYGDYAKKSFEDTKSFVEKLSGVKSLDKALEAQTEFARSSYETFVAEVAEDRGPLHRSRQADLQAATKAWSRSSPRPRTNRSRSDTSVIRKPGRVRPGFFLAPWRRPAAEVRGRMVHFRVVPNSCQEMSLGDRQALNRQLSGPLSNPPEMINLATDSRAGNRAGRRVAPGQRHCACGDPAADPYSRCRSGRWVGPGAAIWKALLGASRWLASEPVAKGPRCALRFPFWNFERLSHVAVNLQSLFVRAGHVIRFCSPNGQ